MTRQTSLDNTMTALADPTRRAILQQVAIGEARVTDVAKPFAMSLNAVSKHIRILERSGLVQRRKSGREHLLTLNMVPFDEAMAWMETQRAFWKQRLVVLDELLQAEDAANEIGEG